MLGSKSPGKDLRVLAIDAVAFLAGRDDLLNRFLDMSGLEVEQLRVAAGKLSFLVCVLDFILGHENDLVDFAGSAGLDPAAVGRIRNQLAIKAGITPEDYPTGSSVG